MIATVHHRPASRVERVGTVVIGGGQAALAVSHHLAERDIDFVTLTDEVRVGDNWRRRWDSLRLFTPARYSGLPGMVFPAPPLHLADKDEVADYLEHYVTRFDLPVRLNARVRSLRWDGSHYCLLIEGSSVEVQADNVVVATGAFQQPSIPAMAAGIGETIHQLHSSRYENPFTLPDGPVLVVGAGNSGAQIALELARFRTVWLSGRNTGHVPRRILGRDIFDWTWGIMKYATTNTRIGRLLRSQVRGGGDALIGIPERVLRGAGIIRVGRCDEQRNGLPVCGGNVLEPRVIVWCTGYRPDFTWIDLSIFDTDGYPRHERGVSSETSGLYFMGLPFQHRMNSSLIGGVGNDAEYIAERVLERSVAPRLGSAATLGTRRAL